MVIEKYFNAFAFSRKMIAFLEETAFACKIFVFSLLRFPEKLCRCPQQHLNIVFPPTSHAIMKVLQMNKEFLGGTKGFCKQTHVFFKEAQMF